MFTKVLIANRGEIACRVIGTCRRLGIATVAVYSEADASALHVRLADEARCVGPSPARDSYLRIDAIIDAAQASGAQAIHPGYGFLSENPAFAERCAQAGLTFIGPPAAAMRAMSSKATAKEIMQRSGVPLLPGYHGGDQGAERLEAEAERIGYPVLIKATAGGGGKGMRVVENAGEFADRLASCQREARQSFGDERVLLERYLAHPRHIEVQVFGDSNGGIVHLFERDCSAQRRHQKVLEEAPAQRLTDAQRSALTRAACDAARAVGYVGAGTVEFLLGEDGAFYFMEMNTRIQVEHPVTEMVTGLDLVEWQLRVAAGEPLPLPQSAIAIDGHSIEVRLYAEIPEAGFLPSSGTLRRFQMPSAGADVRVESGIEAGDSVGIDYDPMLAKLIVHAESRALAIASMQSALRQVRIEGVGNNTMFLRRLVASPAFHAGRIDTGFIEREPRLLGAHAAVPGSIELAAVALWTLAEEVRTAPRAPSVAQSTWNATDGWRLNGHLARTLEFEQLPAGASATHATGAEAYAVAVEYGRDGFELTIAGERAHARLAPQGEDVYMLQFGSVSVRLELTAEAGVVRLVRGEQDYRLRRRDRMRAASHAHEASLAAPMPGRIIAQLVPAGAAVEKGAPLLIMEAMKMEHSIRAPAQGTVRGYRAQIGEQVKEGAQLIDFEEQGAG